MEGRRTGDNDGEQRGRGGGGETILVRGLKRLGNEDDDEQGIYYRWMNFHKVDLKEGGKVEKNWYPELLTWKGVGVMLRAGPKLYIIGGMTDLGLPAAHKHYKCASVLDMKEEEEEEESCRRRIWKQFPLPIFHRYTSSHCASLDGKIYHFEYPSSMAAQAALDPTFNFSRLYPEVYDPIHGLGFWDFIWFPPELPKCILTGAVVPDPANNRILFNQSDAYNLYAYYPRDRTMTLVAGNVYPWSRVVALADDVAFVHLDESTELLHAFDLSRGAKSLEVVWTSTLVTKRPNIVNGFNFASFNFDALFHVGNNNFWFAAWTPDYHGNANLYFIKFKVCRIGDQINCTPLALRSHLLESTAQVYDFLLLDEEACG